MFEDSLIESGNKLKTKRGMTTFVSFLFQMALLMRSSAHSASVH